ncbi:MAG: nitroreductase family protein [Hyphomicrobiales bacterium]
MIEILKKRRSVRTFLDIPVDKEKIEILIQAALLSPTSKDSRPWEFIFVDERELIDKMSECKPAGSQFMKHAPLALVVMAEENKSQAWIEDTVIAANNIQNTAESIDVGSCWVQIRGRMYDDNTTSEEYIRTLFNIPDHFKIECIIALGYKEMQRPPHIEEHLKFDRIHFNSFTKE